jgi:O-antigen/teichoic acid export membrane protein
MPSLSPQSEAGGWRQRFHLVGVFIAYFVSQLGVQAMSLVTGFLIIRVLDKGDYAAYSIINTLGPTMLMLSDNGIGTGIGSIARKVWKDDYEMGSLVNTGLTLRRRFAVVSFLIVSPFLIWTLYTKGVSLIMIALLTLATVVGVSFQLSTAIMRMVLELRQNIKSLGKVSFACTAMRLILVVFFMFAFKLNAFWATLAATGAVSLETYFIARAVRRQVIWDAPVNRDYLPIIYSKVRQTMPLTVYYCFQSQISIWLISLFGVASQVADIGSATRLGVFYGTLMATFSTLMVPRFARNNGRRLLFSQLFQIIGTSIVLLTACTLFAKFVPWPFIMLLGDKYSNMAPLIWLVVLSQGMYSLAGMVYGLNMCKGWIPPAYITIPIELATQIILLLTFNLSKTENVLWFSLLGTVPPLIVTFSLLVRRLREEPEEG